ncbi:MAG: SIS domain-containing protein [Proteobacteria bacterium]|nr:SIS domain-containing protein [Pseudomonadota bacterium]
MDISKFLDDEFAEHLDVARATFAAIRAPFATLLERCVQAIEAGNKIVFFGNGGSAADAQHLAAELVVRYKRDRTALPALALTTDSSALSAIGNDLGFDRLFARQIEALGNAGDVAIGISTSGRSPNVLLGLKAARDKGMTAAAFGGGSGGDLAGVAAPILLIPSHTTARIQEMHIAVGHMLCGAIELELGLVAP